MNIIAGAKKYMPPVTVLSFERKMATRNTHEQTCFQISPMLIKTPITSIQQRTTYSQSQVIIL